MRQTARTDTPIDMDLSVREDVRGGLHDATVRLEDDGSFKFEGNENQGPARITFGCTRHGQSHFSLRLTVSRSGGSSTPYRLDELELGLVRLTASDTPIIPGIVRPDKPTEMTFPKLFVGNTYVFQSQEPGTYPLDRPPMPRRSLSVRVPDEGPATGDELATTDFSADLREGAGAGGTR